MKTRDQQRAEFAYRCVERIDKRDKRDKRANYTILVKNLGANILGSGLAAATAFAQRYHDQGAVESLFSDLSRADIPGLDDGTVGGLARQVRELDLEGYMVATRETLRVVKWLKRALEATKKQSEELR